MFEMNMQKHIEVDADTAQLMRDLEQGLAEAYADAGVRNAGRDIGAELLTATQELMAGHAARKTTFETLPDGRVRRCILGPDGTVLRQELLKDLPLHP